MKLRLYPGHSTIWSIRRDGGLFAAVERSGGAWKVISVGSLTENERELIRNLFCKARFPTRRAALQALAAAFELAPGQFSLKRSGFRAAGFWVTEDGRFALTNHFAYWAGDAGAATATWRVTPPEPEWDEPEESYPQTSAWLKACGLKGQEFATRGAALSALKGALAAAPPTFAAGS